MQKFFGPESKLFQGLLLVFDYMALNIIFLICCIPIVTIGAAKTALYRVMFDLMDDRGNTYKRFFKTFASEFKIITPLSLLKVAIIGLLAYEIILLAYNNIPVKTAVTVVLFLTMLIVGMVFSNIPAQVAMFNATRKQYLRNGVYIALTKPLRCLAVAVMDLLPVFFYLWDFYYMALLGPVWIFFYFSVTVNLSARIWRKPFDSYIENAEN